MGFTAFSPVFRFAFSAKLFCRAFPSPVCCSFRRSSSFLDVLTAGNPEDIRWDSVKSKLESKLETRIQPARWVELQRILKRYSDLKGEMESLRELASSPGDEELEKMAKEELQAADGKAGEYSRQVLELLSSENVTDSDEVVMEFSAGVGGQEAMLFADELFAMYQNFVQNRGWYWEVYSYDTTELGGLRAGSAEIQGPGAYSILKFEGGVHRVQRVPATEKSGRVHTSTVSIAVLPVLPEVEVSINQKDLKVETMRSSGAGGQHVNRTDSKVRLTHLPSGIVVECQEQRDQHQNRARAMRILSSKLLQLQMDSQMSKITSTRKIQVGSRARSEKIRTYNFNQDRITDHRIAHSIHGLEAFLRHGEGLDEFIELLGKEEMTERIAELSEVLSKL